MEDIIVTAQKRAESLQDVPIAISVVTAGSLTNAGIRSTQDLSQSVAGLNVTRTTEATVFTLRGVGTQGGSTGQDSAVATFIDGVYIPSMAGSTFALNNIERIEVLKGPQGTLYGRNATGGAVNVVTRTPKQDLAIEASAGVANLATMEGSFYITGGTGAVAADVAVYYRNQEHGFGENRIINRDINKSRDFIIRSKLLFELGDETRMVFSGDYGRTQGSIAMAYRPVPTSQLVDGTGYAEFIAGGNGYYDSQSEFNPIMDTRMFGGSFRFEHGFGDFMLTNILAFRGADGFQRVEVDATPVKIVDAPLFNSEKQWTEELQLSYGSGPLTAIVGFFYMDATSRYDPFQIAGLAITGQTGGLSNRIINYSAQKTRSYAGFGQATWSVSDNTNLTAGFRYTVDKRTLEAEQSLAIGMPLPDAMCRSFCYPDGTLFPLASFDQSRTFKKPTWRLAVDHQLTPELMLYGSYSRGFKSGVFNLTSPGDPPAQPETLDAFELGFKSTLLDRIRFNAAAFYYDYKNIQAFQVNGATTTLTNAATARIYGFDFDFLAELGAGFSLAGSGAYLHHRYGDFPVATITFLEKPPGAPDYPGYTPGLGNYVFPNCSDSAHTGNFYCSASGNRLVNTPDFSMNLTLNHEMDLGSGRLNSNVNWSYSSSFYWAVDNREKQDSFSLFNAQLAWTAPGDQFSVRLWGRNLGNKKYLVTLNQNGTGDIGSPAPGRTYGVTLGFTY
ncbi:TonB-dependent receptor [Sandaracinobacter sp. RS1-74]|uniref:TonB-dependent receptor n=1 Tax=Sandaracinobacteroides sayramensis TaxID=2913411 RepID=UPI001EDC4C19|nr:TonB-dependent receptor [Sandaracinobacteroides sayramensis]MCG2840963.1 TonB-dependent receptor [Sandaracinobacteroides sayramensis]